MGLKKFGWNWKQWARLIGWNSSTELTHTDLCFQDVAQCRKWLVKFVDFSRVEDAFPVVQANHLCTPVKHGQEPIPPGGHATTVGDYSFPSAGRLFLLDYTPVGCSAVAGGMVQMQATPRAKKTTDCLNQVTSKSRTSHWRIQMQQCTQNAVVSKYRCNCTSPGIQFCDKLCLKGHSADDSNCTMSRWV